MIKVKMFDKKKEWREGIKIHQEIKLLPCYNCSASKNVKEKRWLVDFAFVTSSLANISL